MMKLINFKDFVQFNDLRKKMGADLIELEKNNWESIDKEQLLERLNSIEGIEVSISEIQISNTDYTFEYEGQKVLIYIRDQYYLPEKPNSEYKFHIAKCQTIKNAFSVGRKDKYVVSTRRDSRFLINVRNWYTSELIKDNVIEELHVCKNCLMKLNYNGYGIKNYNKNIYVNFRLEEFFVKYGGTQFTELPRYNELNAPQNEYNKNFPEKSTAFRASKNWICEECNRSFSEYKNFLHTHHKNGNKGDDRNENFKALCISCHAKIPGHEQLRFHPDYNLFVEIFGEWRINYR